jgi:hypothetical protein
MIFYILEVILMIDTDSNREIDNTPAVMRCVFALAAGSTVVTTVATLVMEKTYGMPQDAAFSLGLTVGLVSLFSFFKANEILHTYRNKRKVAAQGRMTTATPS